MNENLYNFYVKKIMKIGRINPLYQYSVLIFLNQGILWDIKKYKESKLYSSIDKKPFQRTEKRVYISVGRRKVSFDTVEPFLRKVDYMATIPPLLYFYPELISETME